MLWIFCLNVCRPEMGIRSPGMELQRTMSHHVYARNQTFIKALQEQQMTLGSKPSTQVLFFYYRKHIVLKHSYVLLVSGSSQENILQTVGLVLSLLHGIQGFHSIGRESLYRGRQLVCIGRNISYGVDIHASIPAFTCWEQERVGSELWQRMNNIQMRGMPQMNMCLAFVEILGCEKQACLNILAFICPSWRHLSGWKLAYERMSAPSQQPCLFSFLATKRCHFEQVPQFPGILNRA